MRLTKPLLALILTATLPFAALAAGSAQGQKATTLTVGDYAVMLAAKTGKGPALDVKSATEAMVKAGVPLGNPKATLNEEKLAEILGFYGLRIKTSTPQQAVTISKAESSLNLVGGAVAVGQSSAGGTMPAPGSLDDCLTRANHGQCVGCCKDLGGSANGCAKFCQQVGTSPGEPLP